MGITIPSPYAALERMAIYTPDGGLDNIRGGHDLRSCIVLTKKIRKVDDLAIPAKERPR